MKGRYFIMEKKITYVEAIETVMAIIGAELYAENGEKITVNEDVVSRMADLKASLEKKSATKKAVDNTGYYSKVEQALANGSLTPTELMAKIDVPNTQKVAAIVKGMSNVDRVVKGKKVFYSLVR